MMFRSRSTLLLVIAIHLVAAGALVQAQTLLHVNGSLTTGAGDGSSWQDAFRGPDALSNALGAATSGDEVWIAEGLYFPSSVGDREAFFPLRAGVRIYGGFQGAELMLEDRPPFGAYPSVLSGDYAQDDQLGDLASMSENCRQVIRTQGATWDALVDGLVVEGGNADGTGSADTRFGGGFYHDLVGGTPRLSHMLFRRNRAVHSGGAIWALGGHIILEDCQFEENNAGLSGGAISATYQSMEVRRCTFTSNLAANSDGGAVHLRSGTATMVEDCLFRRNVAGRDGGALHFSIGSSIEQSHVRGCTFVDNASPNKFIGTAVSARESFSGRYTISNCIAWENRGSAGIDAPSSQFWAALSIEYTIAGGGHDGVGVIDADPRFVDPSNGDYRLDFSSPAIDAGTNLKLTASTVDLGGAPRLFDVSSVADTGVGAAPVVDLGAFESRDRMAEIGCLGNSGCPCGNDSSAASAWGCINSRGQGGILRASGSSRLSLDDLVLEGNALPLGTVALLFAGTQELPAAAAMGDGLRCAGGPLMRVFAPLASPSGNDLQWANGLGAASGVQAGETRVFQAWYRDVGGPCGAGSNVSNAVYVTFLP
jgi:predicted outer membrane repeat protein